MKLAMLLDILRGRGDEWAPYLNLKRRVLSILGWSI